MAKKTRKISKPNIMMVKTVSKEKVLPLFVMGRIIRVRSDKYYEIDLPALSYDSKAELNKAISNKEVEIKK